MSKENDLNAVIAAAAKADKEQLFNICRDNRIFDDNMMAKGVDACAKEIYDIWNNKDRSAEKRDIKDIVGIKTSGIINGLVREFGNKNVLTNQAHSSFNERKNGNINFVPPSASKGKAPSFAPKSPVSLKDAVKAPSFNAPGSASKEQQIKDYENRSEQAKSAAKQKITEAKADNLYTIDNLSLNIDNANIRAAESNYASIDKLNADIEAPKVGKFTREENRLKNMDRINSASDRNADRTSTAKAKRKDIQIPSLKEVMAEFGVGDKKYPFADAVAAFTKAGGKVKEITAALLQQKARLSTKAYSASRTAGNVMGNIKGNVGRG